MCVCVCVCVYCLITSVQFVSFSISLGLNPC